MEQERENVRVIDDPPKPQSSGVFLFRWSIVIGFLVAWMVVLIAAIWIKAGVFRVLLPAILVQLYQLEGQVLLIKWMLVE